MNIFGRVFGGLLVLISLGWLASIAGIRPGFMGSNQISSDNKTGVTNLNTPVKANATGAAPVNGGKATTAKLNAGTQKTAVSGQTTTAQATQGETTGQPNSQTEVEKNPRAAGTGTQAVGNAAPAAAPASPAPVAPAAPVAAGW
jgi:hypothetical protein